MTMELKSDIKDIWRKVRHRDFSGYKGIVIKNSIYQASTTLTAKIGSLIFIIIIARLLMPELFGLYNLALSTILIFTVFAELGIGTTLIRFVSKEFESGNLRPYFLYLGKIKILLILFSVALLIASAGYLANTMYQKPIFLALLAGGLYIIFSQLTRFLNSMIISSNNFKPILKQEIVFQSSRIILVPLVVIFAINYSLSSEAALMLIIIFLALSRLMSSFLLLFDFKKIYRGRIGQASVLNKKERKTINKFLLATIGLSVSGTFFGNIDRIMLGVFVQAEFIGYYTAAFSLVGALTGFAGFYGGVLLPTFSRLKEYQLKKSIKKATRITFVIGVLIFAATLLLAPLGVKIIFGSEYIASVDILRVLSVLIIVLPLTVIYSSYHIARGSPQTILKFLIISTGVNIILNYLLITSLIPYGNLMAVYGASIATLISKFIYLGGLILTGTRLPKSDNINC